VAARAIPGGVDFRSGSEPAHSQAGVATPDHAAHVIAETYSRGVTGHSDRRKPGLPSWAAWEMAFAEMLPRQSWTIVSHGGTFSRLFDPVSRQNPRAPNAGSQWCLRQDFQR